MYNGCMDNTRYYFDSDNECVLAYDRSTDFFTQYDNRQKRWTMSNISFTQFKHDYNYKLIDEEEARALTDVNLPDRLYAEYVAIINDNRIANK